MSFRHAAEPNFYICFMAVERSLEVYVTTDPASAIKDSTCSREFYIDGDGHKGGEFSYFNEFSAKGRNLEDQE